METDVRDFYNTLLTNVFTYTTDGKLLIDLNNRMGDNDGFISDVYVVLNAKI